MPPKTRGTKASKALKENECVLKSKSAKGTITNTKPLRKALADKTNSASDDNTSVLIENTVKHALTKSNNDCENNILRPRRNRKLPNRYNENIISPTVSNTERNGKENTSNIENDTKSARVQTSETRKEPIVVLTPMKMPISPLRNLDNSLLKSRPKRICRLPSKFDDHSISPNKFIPVKPINASTPLANKAKTVNKVNVNTSQIPQTKKKPKQCFQKALQSSETQNTIRNYFNKTPSDTNNNAKQKVKAPPGKSPVKKNKSNPLKKGTSDKDKEITLKRDSSKLDVYEFTYDPNEEPPPAKKKRKRIIKKPAKPKPLTVNSNYDKNLAKALAALKHTVATKSSSPPKITKEQTAIKKMTVPNNNTDSNQKQNLNESIINERKYNSVRVEDIALDMQVEDDNIDYSPINSPNRPKTPIDQNKTQEKPQPLNLQDISFFDEQPAASSSMNTSARHPMASPWRVEFGSLPIKWQVNTYVKPNMTPAFESSFINFNDSNKKHVYTNIIPEANDSLSQIVESPNLKQTSIMSFIKEVVEKSANKKKKSKATPVKANSLFEDTNTSIVTDITPKKHNKKSNEHVTSIKGVLAENNSNNTSSTTDNENALDNSSDKNGSGKNNTYFGFDDTEDQENISPKKKNKARSLRTRTRGILQELNAQKGPMRAVIPVIAKSKPVNNTEGLNKLFGEAKSATEPPVFLEATVNTNHEVNVTEQTLPEVVENDDSQSVHLFEDIDVVHHKKVLFCLLISVALFFL